MKKGILIILVNLIAISAFSQTKNFIDQPYLETRSKVDTLVSPDKIYLQILITEKDSKGKISLEEQEHKMANKLVELGINLKKQLFLDDAASNFKKYFLRKQNVLKSKTYQLIVYDAVSVGKVLTGLESIGISNVDIIKTEYSKIETLKLNLLSKAIAKAKMQAEALVKPLNQKVLNAIYISNNTNYINYSLQGKVGGIKMSLMKDKEQLAPVDIDFQKIKVSSEVFVKFKID